MATTSGLTGTPGSDQILRNSQVSVSLQNVIISMDETLLSLTLPVEFTSTFAGEMNCYLFTRDRDGHATGWQKMASFTVTNGNRAPMNVDLSPDSGSGAKQTLIAVFRDSNGWGDLERNYLLIADNISGADLHLPALFD
jgi:hypothetical protein